MDGKHEQAMNQSDSTSQGPSVPIKTEEKPFSLNRGCEGCLAAFIALLALAFAVSYLLAKFLKLIDPSQEANAVYFVWLVALAIGGYVAARRGKTTGGSNALVVGVFAQLLIVGQFADFA